MATIQNVIKWVSNAHELQRDAEAGIGAVVRQTESLNRVVRDVDNTTRGLGGSISNLVKMFATFVTADLAIRAVGAAFSFVQEAISTAAKAAVSMIQYTAELGDKLFTMAQRTRVSVETLSELRFVAGQTGTDLETIAASTFKLMVNVGNGGTAIRDALGKLGLSLQEIRAMQPADALGVILSKLGEIPNASQQASIGVALFGRQFQSIAQLTQEDIGKLITRARELGVTMTTELAVASDRFGDAVGEIQAMAEALGMKIAGAVLPGLITFVEQFTNAWQAAVKGTGLSSDQIARLVDELVVQIGEAVARTIVVIANLIDAFTKLASGEFLRGAALLDFLARVGQMLLVVQRLSDDIFHRGRNQGALDDYEKLLSDLRGFASGVAVATMTGGAGLRTLAETTAEAARKAGAGFKQAYGIVKQELAAAADAMRNDLRAMGETGAAIGAEAARRVEIIWDSTARFMEDSIRAIEAAQSATRRAIGMRPVIESGNAVLAWTNQLKETASVADSIFKKFSADSYRKNVERMAAETPSVVQSLINPFEAGFKSLGERLPDLIFGNLRDGLGAVALATALTFGEIFLRQFQDNVSALPILANGTPDFSKLKPSQRVAAVAGMGLSTFTTGFGIGASTNKTTGVLGGAAAGALMGANPALAGATLGLSIGIGAVAGAIGGWFGGRSAEKKAREQMEADRQAWVQQFGGMDKLNTLATQLGVNLGNAFSTKKPEEFQRHVDRLNRAIDQMNGRIERLQKLTQNGLLATPDDLRAIAQMGGTDQEQQALIAFMQGQVDRVTSGLGQFLEHVPITNEVTGLAAIGALVATAQQMSDMGMDAIEIAKRLAPLVESLQAKLQKLGLGGTEAFDRLADTVKLFTNEAIQPSIAAVQGYVSTVTGLHNLGLLTDDMFKGLSLSIVDVNKNLLDQGLSQEQALLVIRPALQTMWQMQKDFGFAVDDATQALIDQGVEAGIVGDQFRDPMDRMIKAVETLVERIGDFLEALGLIGPTAESAADRAGRALDGIRPPRIDDRPLPDGGRDGDFADFAATGGLVGMGRILPFRTGGIVPRYFDIGGMVGQLVNFVPKGTDTVPAMLTPGEVVLNAAQQRNVAGAVSDRRGDTTVNIVLPGLVVDSRRRVDEIKEVIGEVMDSREFSEEFQRQVMHNGRGIRSAIRKAS